MNFSYEDLLSIGEVLADVLVEVDDQEMKKLTPGFYRKQVKRALDELSFDTLFVDASKDFIIPDDLKLPIPKGVFHIKTIQVYSGTPDDVGYVENVYYKRNFVTEGKTYKDGTLSSSGYTANNHQYNVTDPFVKASFLRQVPTSAFYFNVQNGIIMLSDACENYDYIRVGFNGIASASLDIDKIKIIPPFVYEAIVLWVVERAARALKSTDGRDRRYRTIQIDASQQLDKSGMNGLWHEAKMRLGQMDKKMWNDLVEYSSKMAE